MHHTVQAQLEREKIIAFLSRGKRDSLRHALYHRWYRGDDRVSHLIVILGIEVNLLYTDAMQECIGFRMNATNRCQTQ